MTDPIIDCALDVSFLSLPEGSTAASAVFETPTVTSMSHNYCITCRTAGFQSQWTCTWSV